MGQHVAMSAHPPSATASSGKGESDSRAWLKCLPVYLRSLLKIQVPVTVTLSTKRQPVRNILELVPGAILQFDKLCDETLSLEVGGHPVAEGETVKVGDKFGLRLTSMVLPEERFQAIKGGNPVSPPPAPSGNEK